ncbi:MAG: hypothetical protein CYPHOPRED_001058, partial [Cyphobasidiales sp. Tagirdzhanova-0007]
MKGTPSALRLHPFMIPPELRQRLIRQITQKLVDSPIFNSLVRTTHSTIDGFLQGLEEGKGKPSEVARGSEDHAKGNIKDSRTSSYQGSAPPQPERQQQQAHTQERYRPSHDFERPVYHAKSDHSETSPSPQPDQNLSDLEAFLRRTKADIEEAEKRAKGQQKRRQRNQLNWERHTLQELQLQQEAVPGNDALVFPGRASSFGQLSVLGCSCALWASTHYVSCLCASNNFVIAYNQCVIDHCNNTDYPLAIRYGQEFCSDATASEISSAQEIGSQAFQTLGLTPSSTAGTVTVTGSDILTGTAAAVTSVMVTAVSQSSGAGTTVVVSPSSASNSNSSASNGGSAASLPSPAPTAMSASGNGNGNGVGIVTITAPSNAVSDSQALSSALSSGLASVQSSGNTASPSISSGAASPTSSGSAGATDSMSASSTTTIAIPISGSIPSSSSQPYTFAVVYSTDSAGPSPTDPSVASALAAGTTIVVFPSEASSGMPSSTPTTTSATSSGSNTSGGGTAVVVVPSSAAASSGGTSMAATASGSATGTNSGTSMAATSSTSATGTTTVVVPASSSTTDTSAPASGSGTTVVVVPSLASNSNSGVSMTASSSASLTGPATTAVPASSSATDTSAPASG